MMGASVKEFLETYDLYQKFTPGNGVGWDGEWPAAADAPCPTCGEKRPHSLWPSKVAGGFTREWGVYMIYGTCARCSSNRMMFWVEVDQREGWMQKAGQLPAAALTPA
jgi:hypothetical protein